MRVLQKHGADINFPDKVKTNLSIKTQNTNMTGFQISHSQGGCTPLFRVAMKQNMPLLKLLLEWGADIDKCESGGHTPLAICVVYRNMNAMKALIEAGAAVNFPNTDRCTPLAIAAGAGFGRVVEILIKHGANATAKDKNVKAYKDNHSYGTYI